jgi:hypothetical protein
MHAFLILFAGGVAGWIAAAILLGVLETPPRRRL